MHPKCPAPSPFAGGCLLIALTLLAAHVPATAGNNPDVTFVLHAQSISAGGCNATGQPDCVTDQPTVNVPASTQQRIFVYVHNVTEVAGAQTAFQWDPSWDLLGSSWNCQGNQLTISTPDPATNGGPTDGSLVTTFDCTMDSTMVLLGYMDFDVGTNGCLEQVDFGTEVFVARAPVNTPDEAATFVRKVLTYARAPGQPTIAAADADYHSSLLLMAGHTSSTGANGGNGLFMAEEIREASGAPRVTRLYEDWFFDAQSPCGHPQDDPCALDGALDDITEVRDDMCARADSTAILEASAANRFNRAGMVDSLNAGHGYVFHVEHSDVDRLGSAGNNNLGGPECIGANLPSHPRQLTRGDVLAIDSGNKFGIFMSFGCGQNAIDKESVSEQLVRLPTGGAVAYLSKTRSPGFFLNLARSFFAACFNKTLYNDLGTAAYPWIDAEAAPWYQLLLGDPAMPLFADAPTTLSLGGSGVSATLSPGRHTLEFEVKENGQPIEGALVCLTQDTGGSVGSRLYRFAETRIGDPGDPALVQFDVHITEAVPLQVTVTAPNAAPDTTVIPVGIPPTSGSEFVYVGHDLGVLDDNEGRALAGTSGTVTVTVENLGPADADSVMGILSSWGRVEFDLGIDGVIEGSEELLEHVYIGSSLRNPPMMPFSYDQLIVAGISPEGAASFPDSTSWGYLLWRQPSDRQWYLRWRSAVDAFADSVGFSGTIRSAGGFNGVSPVDFELLESDSFTENDTEVVFDGVSWFGNEDGLDLRIEDWNNVLVDSVAQSFGDIDSSTTASAGFAVQVKPGAEDLHEILLQLEILQGGVPTDFVLFTVPITAPKLETVVQRPIARAGTPDTVDLYVRVRNRGTGSADAASVMIEAEEKATVLVDSLAAGELLPGEEVEVGPLVLLQQTGDPDSVRLAVTLENTYAGGDKVVWSRSGADVGTPEPVSVIETYPGPGGNLVRWEQSTTTTVAGYNVYRRPTGVPSATRVNDSLVVEASLFFDTFDFGGLGHEHEQEYQYEVRAVDASWNESAGSEESTVTTWLEPAPGWPQEIDVATEGSVLVADIDGDGDKEILHAGRAVYAWHHDGTEVVDGDGDSTTTGIFYNAFGNVQLHSGRRFMTDLAARDSLIVGASWGDTTYFWKADGTLIDRKRVYGNSAGGATFANPVIEDLNGDGQPEILVSTRTGVLHAWTFDGSSVQSYAADDSTAFPGAGAYCYGGPAVGQLDSLPEFEVVYAIRGASGGTTIWALDNALETSGSPKPSSLSTNDALWTYQYWYSGSPSSPTLANIDGDPEDEVVVAIGRPSDQTDRVLVLDHDGTFMWQRLVEMGDGQRIPRPLVADLDDDGDMEIVVGDGVGDSHGPQGEPHGSVLLRIFDHNGNEEIWTLTLIRFFRENSFGARSRCIAVDADKDGDLELMHGTEPHQVVAWNAKTGTVESGWPIVLRESVRGAVTVTDIDGDNLNEVVASDMGGLVYVWEYGDAATHTPEPDGMVTPVRHWLGLSRPNPFNPLATIPYAVSHGGEVRLRVYDVAGRMVRELVKGHHEQGAYEVSWNGRDEHGAPLGSGVYFYDLQVDGRRIGSHKFVMIR